MAARFAKFILELNFSLNAPVRVEPGAENLPGLSSHSIGVSEYD